MKSENNKKSLDSDVVVIGAGGSGLAAAVAASEKGARVKQEGGQERPIISVFPELVAVSRFTAAGLRVKTLPIEF